MRVDVRGHREIALTDEFGDASPGNAAQVQQADSPVPEIVRAPLSDALGLARLRDRGAQRVGA
jgi:hypothetical protein